MMKNAFYYILKALFILKIFKFFFLTFLLCRKYSLLIYGVMVKLYGYDMMKCRRNVNFQEMYTEHSTGKNDGF